MKVDLKVITTLRCSRSCPNCYQRPIMNAKPDYQATLKDMRLILNTGVKFHSLLFTGGEPTCWDYLEEASIFMAEHVKKGQITKFGIITNAMNPVRIIALKDHINSLFVTGYGGNGANVVKLKNVFGNKCAIWLREVMAPPIKEIVPPEKRGTFGCRCVGPVYYDGRFYSCSMVPALVKTFGPGVANEKASTPPTPDWPKKLEYHQELCWACISNSAVRRLKPPHDSMQA